MKERRPAAITASLSVIIPVYNEVASLAEVVDRVAKLSDSVDVLIVDDGSTDGTAECIARCIQRGGVRALSHPENRGKGAAIRSALPHALGDIIVIQDADLEYDPVDIERLVRPIIENRADVVYGSRFADRRRSGGRVHRAANYLLTRLSNRFTGLRLTDMETCYKAMRRDVALSMVLRENRFGIEPEITAKIARGKWRVMEVPISYHARSYAAGKKIGFRDGLRALWCIVRYSRRD